MSKRKKRVGGIPVPADEPVLVAFLGTTGAGKSNLIMKLLLDTHNALEASLVLDTGDDIPDKVRAKGDPRNPVHDIDFFHDVIDDLNHRRVTGAYSDGCYAPEMLADPSPPRARPR